MLPCLLKDVRLRVWFAAWAILETVEGLCSDGFFFPLLQIVEYPYRDRAVITDQCGNLFKVSPNRNVKLLKLRLDAHLCKLYSLSSKPIDHACD